MQVDKNHENYQKIKQHYHQLTHQGFQIQHYQLPHKTYYEITHQFLDPQNTLNLL